MSFFLACVLGVLLACVSQNTWSAEEGSEQDPPLNRVDFTSVFFDSLDTDRLTGQFGYTRTLSPSSKLGVRLLYLDSRFGERGGSGPGDTTVTWSWLPGEQMSIAPWLPRLVGSGVSVTLPTGDETLGRGLGSTIITPFVGTVLPLIDSLSLAPSLAYAHSIDPVITGEDLRIALLDIGLSWAGKNGWWASVYVGYVMDLEASSTTTGGRLSAGKVFNSGWGFSAHFIDLESFRPGLLPPQDNRFDQVYEFTVMYGF